MNNTIQIIDKNEFIKENKAAQVAFVDHELDTTIKNIIKQVIEKGDQALYDLTEQFDRVQLSALRVPIDEIKAQEEKLDHQTKHILLNAIDNIRVFHEKTKQQGWQNTDESGTTLGQIVQPIDRVGVYIPGGKAVYPSSVIMNIIPVQIAEVPSIVVVSPPGKNGLPHPLILAACSLLNIEDVFSIGGAQAIAALAFGTNSIQKVNFISGPGNSYVAGAKRLVYGQVGIDSLAGPSEILILHDRLKIDPEYIAYDLLAQAEHDQEAKALFFTTDALLAEQVQKAVNAIVPKQKRKKILEQSLKNNGRIVIFESIKDAIEQVNEIAPEHLEILTEDDQVYKKIRNAGAIFDNQWSCEALGDYFAGPNHTIPTSGAAKFSSPLSVQNFQKTSSYLSYSELKYKKQAPSIIQFAQLEGLQAHADSVKVRLD